MRSKSWKALCTALMLLCFAGVLATSAVATAGPEYYINKVKLTGTEKVALAGGATILSFNVSGSEIKVSCKKLNSSGEIQVAGKYVGGGHLEECKAESPRGCLLGAAQEKAIDLGRLEGALQEEGGKYFATLVPANTQEEFLVLSFEKCTNIFWSGSHTILGHIRASVDTGSEALKHTLTFSSTTGSTLRWAGNLGTFTSSDTLELTGTNKGKLFGINQ
jgi:hypothetical protein